MSRLAALCVLTAVVSLILAAERARGWQLSVVRRSHVTYLLATAGWAVGAVGMLGGGASTSWSLPVRLVSQTVVVGSVCFLSVALSDASWRPGARSIALLSIQPLVTLGVTVTNPWHHLVVTGPPGHAAWGPLYWVHVAVSYAIFAVAIVTMVRRRASTPMLETPFLSAVVVSWFFPVVGNVATILLFRPDQPDLTPPAFLLTAVVVGYAIRSGLEQLVPIARTRVFESITDALLVIGPAGALVDANPAGIALLARSAANRHTVMGRPLDELSPQIAAIVGAGEGEHDLAGTDGRLVLDTRETLLADNSGQVLGRLVVLRDVTEAAESRRLLSAAHAALRSEAMVSERLRAELAEQAVRDPGTGLHNRRHLDERLSWLIDHADARPLSVVMVDIDHFKQVNDTHGHAAGDRVLRAVAGILDAHAGSVGGEAIRYGGDEFFMLLPGVEGDEARRLAEDARRACRGVEVGTDDGGIGVTVSAGVARWSAGMQAIDLFAAADAALYAAKGSGRDRNSMANVDPARAPS